MSEVSRPNIEIWKRRFRRLYSADLAALETLSDQIAAEAGETITINRSQEDGNVTEGILTGNKLEMLGAAEELITELDTAAPLPPSRSRCIIPDFSCARP